MTDKYEKVAMEIVHGTLQIKPICDLDESIMVKTIASALREAGEDREEKAISAWVKKTEAYKQGLLRGAERMMAEFLLASTLPSAIKRMTDEAEAIRKESEK